MRPVDEAEGPGNGASMSSDEASARSIGIAGIDNGMQKHNEPVCAPSQSTFLFAHRILGTAFAAGSALQLDLAIRPL